MIFCAGLLFVSHCVIDLYNGPFVAIFIFPPICRQAHQKIGKMFVFNDLYAGWLFKCHCTIELFNGRFVRNLFSPSMQKKNEPNERNVFFYDSYVGQLFESHCAISPFSRQKCRQSCQNKRTK